MDFNHYRMNLDPQEKRFIMKEKCHRIEGENLLKTESAALQFCIFCILETFKLNN